MTPDQLSVFTIIGLSLVLFIWNKWRYDLVALMALFACVITGVVPAEKAFSGLADPVVITVATVLVISAAVSRSGFIDWCLKLLSHVVERKNTQIFMLVLMVMMLSAFMNNVGALAVFLPIALAFAHKSGRSASEILMPLSFGSLLGGLVTVIGTPPNLLISGVRQQMTGEPFRMFDFAPVGLGLCVVGLLYLVLAWRLIPKQRRGATAPEDQFCINDYISEVIVSEESPWVGKSIREAEQMAEDNITIVGIAHNALSTLIPAGYTTLAAGNTLLLESDPVLLNDIVSKYKLELAGSKEIEGFKLTSDEVGVVEAVVTAESILAGRTIQGIKLRSRYGVNLLAVRQAKAEISDITWKDRIFGKQEIKPKRLKDCILQEGDIIALQGQRNIITDTLADLGCLPLAERNLQLGRGKKNILPVIILVGCILLTVSNTLPISIAFLGGVLAIGILKILRLNEMYEAIDAPVIVLLAAMIPVTAALSTTGGTQIIADYVMSITSGLSAYMLLSTIIIATMLVTPFLNNAATVLLMAPIAATIAQKMEYNIDPFLMAVAIGASCDFLTPIGHQSNTLVMAPGGYKFSDYWRLGLPLSILIVICSVPLILAFWPVR